MPCSRRSVVIVWNFEFAILRYNDETKSAFHCRKGCAYRAAQIRLPAMTMIFFLTYSYE